MPAVVFLDSSVLLNLLDVPGKNSDHRAVRTQFLERVDADETFVVPITAVVEVGNHIANLEDGDLRRHRSKRFATILRRSLVGTLPWVVSAPAWDETFLAALLDGDDEQATYLPGLVDLATQGVGAGDAAILHEMRRYRARTDIPSGQTVELWTLDTALEAWAP